MPYSYLVDGVHVPRVTALRRIVLSFGCDYLDAVEMLETRGIIKIKTDEIGDHLVTETFERDKRDIRKEQSAARSNARSKSAVGRAA